jgi:hypothetical protein
MFAAAYLTNHGQSQLLIKAYLEANGLSYVELWVDDIWIALRKKRNGRKPNLNIEYPIIIGTAIPINQSSNLESSPDLIYSNWFGNFTALIIQGDSITICPDLTQSLPWYKQHVGDGYIFTTDSLLLSLQKLKSTIDDYLFAGNCWPFRRSSFQKCPQNKFTNFRKSKTTNRALDFENIMRAVPLLDDIDFNGRNFLVHLTAGMDSRHLVAYFKRNIRACLFIRSSGELSHTDSSEEVIAKSICDELDIPLDVLDVGKEIAQDTGEGDFDELKYVGMKKLREFLLNHDPSSIHLGGYGAIVTSHHRNFNLEIEAFTTQIKTKLLPEVNFLSYEVVSLFQDELIHHLKSSDNGVMGSVLSGKKPLREIQFLDLYAELEGTSIRFFNSYCDYIAPHSTVNYAKALLKKADDSVVSNQKNAIHSLTPELSKIPVITGGRRFDNVLDVLPKVANPDFTDPDGPYIKRNLILVIFRLIRYWRNWGVLSFGPIFREIAQFNSLSETLRVINYSTHMWKHRALQVLLSAKIKGRLRKKLKRELQG